MKFIFRSVFSGTFAQNYTFGEHCDDTWWMRRKRCFDGVSTLVPGDVWVMQSDGSHVLNPPDLYSKVVGIMPRSEPLQHHRRERGRYMRYAGSFPDRIQL